MLRDMLSAKNHTLARQCRLQNQRIIIQPQAGAIIGIALAKCGKEILPFRPVAMRFFQGDQAAFFQGVQAVDCTISRHPCGAARTEIDSGANRVLT